MGRMQRVKGATYERWVANVLKAIWPGAKRGIGQTRAAGDVPDVDGTPYWIECKHHAGTVNIRAAFDQALTACSDARRVVVISKVTGSYDLATMDLAMFVELMQELERLRRE